MKINNIWNDHGSKPNEYKILKKSDVTFRMYQVRCRTDREREREREVTVLMWSCVDEYLQCSYQGTTLRYFELG